MLADEKETYSQTGKICIPTPASYKDAYPFLRDVDSLALSNVWLDLNHAFSNFFKNPKQFGMPKFKAKHYSHQSYTTNNKIGKSGSTIYIVHNGIRLPKVGIVKIVKADIYRTPQTGWRLKSATVSRTKTGKYFCSILYEVAMEEPEEILPTQDNTVGLDYSSPNFYVDDHGNSSKNEHWYRKEEAKLARFQRELSHMQKGSKIIRNSLKRLENYTNI